MTPDLPGLPWNLRVQYRRYKNVGELYECIGHLLGPEHAEDAMHAYTLAIKYTNVAFDVRDCAVQP